MRDMKWKASSHQLMLLTIQVLIITNPLSALGRTHEISMSFEVSQNTQNNSNNIWGPWGSAANVRAGLLRFFRDKIESGRAGNASSDAINWVDDSLSTVVGKMIITNSEQAQKKLLLEYLA